MAVYVKRDLEEALWEVFNRMRNALREGGLELGSFQGSLSLLLINQVRFDPVAILVESSRHKSLASRAVDLR